MSADLIKSWCWLPGQHTWLSFCPYASLDCLQDPFPKGVIPLTAIEMTRSNKDNKFQVITGQRVFVFRTESEGENQGPLCQGGGRKAV